MEAQQGRTCSGQQARFQHFCHPQIDAVIELLPIRKIQAQPDRGEPGRDGLGTAIVLRDGLPGFQIDLQRTQKPLPVLDSLRRLRVDGAQPGGHGLQPLRIRLGLQALPDTGGGKRRKVVAPDERIHIQPRAARNNGGLPPGDNVLHNGRSLGAVAADGIVLLRGGHIDHVVGNALHLRFRGLGRADIHAAIDLHGVAGDHLAIQFLGQLHRQGGFPGGRRPRKANNWVHGLRSFTSS